MRTARLGVALLALAFAQPAWAQESLAGVGDVPAGPARLVGHVVHARRPEAAADVAVVLYALDASGRAGTRQVQTDSQGEFVFENISNETQVVYLLGARFQEVPFPGERFVFGPGEVEHRSQVEIHDPTRDSRHISVKSSELRLEWIGDQLGVSESHLLFNASDKVVYVPSDSRAGARPAFTTQLLPGLEEFSMPFGIIPEGFEQEGTRLRYWGPLYPGDHELSFSYSIPTEPGAQTLRRSFSDGAERLRVLSLADGPVRGAEPLAQAENQIEAGRELAVWERGDLPRGFEVALQLEVPETRHDPAALTIREVRLVLEFDEVALIANENLILEVTGPTSLVAADEPLLHVPLPDGARDLRFSASAMGLGLTSDGENGLFVRGPIPPGQTDLGVSYRLPASADGLEFERRYARRVPLLDVFVADTGVILESDRMHRRRPVLTPDRSYLKLEAFELEVDEPAGVRLAPIPARGGVPRPLLLTGVGIVALLCLALVLRPATARRTDRDEPGESPSFQEREALYEAIRDLDHDFETGKVSEADHQAMHQELRARAVELLRTEQASQESFRVDASVAKASDGCPGCGNGIEPGARFCAHCGQRLVEADA